MLTWKPLKLTRSRKLRNSATNEQVVIELSMLNNFKASDPDEQQTTIVWLLAELFANLCHVAPQTPSEG